MARIAHVAHIIEGLHPDRGGPPVVAAQLAAAQARAGHRVAILCEARGSDPRAVHELLSRVRGGNELELVFVASPRDAGAALFGRPLLDVAHVHGVWNPISLHASRAARRRGIPYVLSTHGALHPSCVEEGKLKKRVALALGWRAMLRGAARVLVLNDEERAFADELTRSSCATTLPNGVDLAAIPPVANAGTSDARGDRREFVFLGRLDRIKGIDLLLEAYADFARADVETGLAIAGPDWGEERALRAQAARLGLEPRVRFLGPIYDERKWSLLREAIAYVHLPRYEGFGLSVIEALAVGTPAVIGPRCLLPSVGESDGVIVSRGDASSFAAEMRRIARDTSLRARLSAAARESVARRFDWEVIAAQSLRAAGIGNGGA